MKRAVLLVGVAALCIGCGGTQVRTVTVRSTAQPHHCVGLTGYSISGYELCDSRTFRFAGRLIDVARPPGSPSGIWIDGFVAPDAKTLLVQWSAECETPYAFFVPTRGGVPRLVTGERSMKNAPISIADGWTSDGRAIVELPRGGCGGGADRPGIYLIGLDGKKQFVAPLRRGPGP